MQELPETLNRGCRKKVMQLIWLQMNSRKPLKHLTALPHLGSHSTEFLFSRVWCNYLSSKKNFAFSDHTLELILFTFKICTLCFLLVLKSCEMLQEENEKQRNRRMDGTALTHPYTSTSIFTSLSSPEEKTWLQPLKADHSLNYF